MCWGRGAALRVCWVQGSIARQRRDGFRHLNKQRMWQSASCPGRLAVTDTAPAKASNVISRLLSTSPLPLTILIASRACTRQRQQWHSIGAACGTKLLFTSCNEIRLPIHQQHANALWKRSQQASNHRMALCAPENTLRRPPAPHTCRQPMMPGTTPSTPASEQRLQFSGAGASGNRQR